MGERSDQIEEQIHRTRADLRDNLSELEDKIKSAFDWRTQFEERPLTALTVAVGGGMLLAALLPRGGHRRRRREYSDASVRSEVRRPAEAEPGASKAGLESNGSLDALKGAFMTAAASHIGGFLGQLLAGYRQESERWKREQRHWVSSKRPEIH
jgi:hypothetical protein